MTMVIALSVALAWAPVCKAESGAQKREQKPGKTKKGTAGKKTPAAKGKKGKGHVRNSRSRQTKKVAAQEAPPLGHPLVKDMRLWSNPDYTRIAVSLDHEVQYEYHQLPANREAGVPPRLYIDLKGARIAPGVKDIPIGDGLLKTARIAQFRSDTVRVVLDMDSIRDYKVFTFSDPFRVIVDVRGERREELRKAQEPALASLPVSPPAPPAPVPIPAREERKKREMPAIGKVRRIVVDPGHGGHDPGAIGHGGTKEKDVVLQIGLKLAKILRDELGLDVVMTRSTDVFIELQERTAIANKVGADLFVSIHANAALNRNMSGIETYYLNLAKTAKVAELAARENNTRWRR